MFVRKVRLCFRG
uniref:Uncharacterized protein n=1 Tax=Arundo donax TaxID=35708 RepID=A0A0A9BL47_ARUDO